MDPDPKQGCLASLGKNSPHNSLKRRGLMKTLPRIDLNEGVTPLYICRQ